MRATKGAVNRRSLFRGDEFSVDNLEQLADAELVHAGLAVVRFGPERLVEALGEADGDDPGWLAAVGGGTATLCPFFRSARAFGSRDSTQKREPLSFSRPTFG